MSAIIKSMVGFAALLFMSGCATQISIAIEAGDCLNVTHYVCEQTREQIAAQSSAVEFIVYEVAGDVSLESLTPSCLVADAPSCIGSNFVKAHSPISVLPGVIHPMELTLEPGTTHLLFFLLGTQDAKELGWIQLKSVRRTTRRMTLRLEGYAIIVMEG